MTLNRKPWRLTVQAMREISIVLMSSEKSTQFAETMCKRQYHSFTGQDAQWQANLTIRFTIEIKALRNIIIDIGFWSFVYHYCYVMPGIVAGVWLYIEHLNGCEMLRFHNDSTIKWSFKVIFLAIEATAHNEIPLKHMVRSKRI